MGADPAHRACAARQRLRRVTPTNGPAGRLVFLGTGAAGGTPGRGRAARLESSLLLDAGARILIDVTRDFDRQRRYLDEPFTRDAPPSYALRRNALLHSAPRLDAVLLTHAHRDASGGLPRLARWLSAGGSPPVPLFAHPQTVEALRARYRRFAAFDLHPLAEGASVRIGPWLARPLAVPHARDTPTYAWRLTRHDPPPQTQSPPQARARAGSPPESSAGSQPEPRAEWTMVYASDVAALTPDLERFTRGAALLVLDAAMWGRSIFSHLRADRALPEVCAWDVGEILLTQIGRTAPQYPAIEREARRLCPRARPAHDGLTYAIPPPSA